LGSLTFEIIRRAVADILTATDEELIEGMRFLAERMKIVVEPTGCLGFAASRARRATLAGQRVGVILSGGNVDAARFAELVGGAPEAASAPAAAAAPAAAPAPTPLRPARSD
jgi:threonine dehydratase